MENIIGTRLQQLIKEHEQTNAKAAEAIGVSASLISDIINGKKKQGIGADVVKKLCEHYHVSSDWLLGIAPVSDERRDFETAVRVTGLSERAIESLATTNKHRAFPDFGAGLLTIDALILSPDLVDAIKQYCIDSLTWINLDMDNPFECENVMIYQLVRSSARNSLETETLEEATTPVERSLAKAINIQNVQDKLSEFREQFGEALSQCRRDLTDRYLDRLKSELSKQSPSTD